jgi:CYTH domain-containing protein
MRANNKETIDKFAFLQEVSIFTIIPVERLWEISGKAIIRNYKREDFLIMENDSKATLFYVLVNGEAMISNSGQKIGVMGKGSFYGHNEIITGSEFYLNSVQMLSPTAEFFLLPRRAFLNLFNDYPDFVKELAKFSSIQVLKNSKKLAEEAAKNRNIDIVLGRFDAISKEILKTMGREEIERKYLLKENFDIDILKKSNLEYETFDIIQVYTKIEDEDEFEQRIRKFGDGYFKAEKTGKGKTRQEKEWVITKDEFDKESKEIAGIPIEKDRYQIKDPRYREIVIDIYKGKLAPLRIIEVEFLTNVDSANFKPPRWLSKYIVKEVTEDHRYKNKNLFQKGRPE